MTTTLSLLGNKLRKRRKELDLTIADLANMTGYSVGHISQIERGVSAPSMTGLQAIARCLNLSLQDCFISGAQRQTVPAAGPTVPSMGLAVVHADQRIRYFAPSCEIASELLTPQTKGNYAFVWVRLPAGGEDRPVATSHWGGGEECSLIVQGTVQAWVNGESVVLNAGDSIWFNAAQEHRYVNVGTTDALIVQLDVAC